MKYSKILLALSTFITTSIAHADNLRQIAEIGLSNDLKIEQLTTSFFNSVEKENEVNGRFGPQINLQASGGFSVVEETSLQNYNNVTTGSLGLNASYILYDGSKKPLQTIQSYQSMLDYFTLEEHKQIVLNEISNIYYNVLRNEEILKTDLENKKSVQKQFDQIKNMVDYGLKTNVDLAEVQAELDIAESNILTSENNLQNTLSQLYLYTGKYDLKPEKIKFEDIKKDFENEGYKHWFETMKVDNFSIKKAKTKHKISKENIKAIKADDDFKIHLTGGINSSYNNRAFNEIDNTANIGFKIDFPVYTSGVNHSLQVQAKNDFINAGVDILYSFRQLEPSLKILLNELDSIDRQIISLKKVVVSTNRSLEATQSGYEAGTKDIVDVLNANTQYFISLKNVANAEYDYLIKQNELLLLVGGLTLDKM